MLGETKEPAVAHLVIDGQDVEYRLVDVQRAGKLRIRVGLNGVEVLRPVSRPDGEVESFLEAHVDWLLSQLDRLARLRSLRRISRVPAGEILFQGARTPVQVEDVALRARSNRVQWHDGHLIIVRGRRTRVSAATTLENWLRREARAQIRPVVQTFEDKLGVVARRLYIMDQQTKWASCSALRNLSFNWRIVMAPDAVLQYLVAHEVVHLAVPDHSRKFWLTLQSVCPESERARQWLSANGHQLRVRLPEVLAASTRRGTEPIARL
jgi:predicted metal-dependent hydrolase